MQDRDVVEVRVHGVSGTPPQDLLDRPNVVLLDGDARAGFYRSANPDDIGDRYVSRPGASIGDFDGPYLEGYAWGGLTSGSAWRSLWLLLLPFSLLNVAPRLRPADPPTRLEGRRSRRLYLLWLLGRWLALCSTAVFVMAFIGVGMDLTGYQCAPVGTLHGRSAVGRRHPVRPHRVAPISRRRARAAARPRAAVAHRRADDRPLRGRRRARHARRTARERTRAARAEVALDVAERASGAQAAGSASADRGRHGRRVRGRRRWTDGCTSSASSSVSVRRYSRLVAVAIESFTAPYESRGWTIASLVCWLALLGAGAAEGIRLAFVADKPAVATTVAIARVHGGTECVPARRRRRACPATRAPRCGCCSPSWACCSCCWSSCGARPARLAQPKDFGERGPSAGHGGLRHLGAVGDGGVHGCGVHRGRLPVRRRLAAQPITRFRVRPTSATLQPYFSYPEVIVDAGTAYAVAVAFAALVLIGVRHLRRDPPGARARHEPADRARRRRRPTTAATGPTATRKRRKAILRAMWLGGIVDIGGRPIVLLMVAGAVMSEIVGVLFVPRARLRCLCSHRLVARRHAASASSRYATWKLLGAYAVVLTLIGLVVLGYYAFRKQSLRRSVGILWDLASFWPRLVPSARCAVLRRAGGARSGRARAPARQQRVRRRCWPRTAKAPC